MSALSDCGFALAVEVISNRASSVGGCSPGNVVDVWIKVGVGEVLSFRALFDKARVEPDAVEVALLTGSAQKRSVIADEGAVHTASPSFPLPLTQCVEAERILAGDAHTRRGEEGPHTVWPVGRGRRDTHTPTPSPSQHETEESDEGEEREGKPSLAAPHSNGGYSIEVIDRQLQREEKRETEVRPHRNTKQTRRACIFIKQPTP